MSQYISQKYTVITENFGQVSSDQMFHVSGLQLHENFFKRTFWYFCSVENFLENFSFVYMIFIRFYHRDIIAQTDLRDRAIKTLKTAVFREGRSGGSFLF
jgi:hypothetical protein